MDRKLDKRNLNTKLQLANAFKELCQTKSMNKISINDLIKHCNINRNTFYYHFEDIYDLMNWVFEQEVKKIMEGFDNTNLEALLNRVFDYVEINKHLLKSAYNSFGREQLKGLLHPHFYDILDMIISNYISENHLSVESSYKDFLVDFYSEGIANSIVNYFKGKQDITRETLIRYLLSLKDSIPLMSMK